MKVVIIEDELLMAKDLATCIHAAEPSAEVVAILASVREAIDYFRSQSPPDVIFSDIQLGDGLSFAIFEANAQTIPVIFCTAYDEYALDAFRAAGIDYILKPFTARTIAAALAKFKVFRGVTPSYSGLSRSFGHRETGSGQRQVGDERRSGDERRPGDERRSGDERRPGEERRPGDERRQGSILVHYKEKIVPIETADIALFYLQHEVTRMVTFGKQQYLVSKNLEELERTVAGRFYRANRQYLVNRRAIKDVSQYFGRRLLLNLSIPFDEKVTVGRLKANHFLEWLAEE